MKVTKETTLSSAYVLTRPEIERIYQYFESSDNIIIKAMCKDGLIREFKTVAEFVEYENVPDKAINFIGINVFTKDWEFRALIHFGSTYGRNVTIKLEGEEQQVMAIYEFIKNRLHALKPWYWFMTGNNLRTYILDMIIVIALFSPLYVVISRISWPSFTVMLVCLIILTLAINAVWSLFKSRLFPSSVFAIGQGKKRHTDYDVYRQLFFVGMVIEIIGGIITNAMFK